MKKNLFVGSILALSLFQVQAAKKIKPNVILIITDDQGYGDVAANGNKVIKTPNMDKLYHEGVRFTNFHAGTTCAPSRSGLMAGIRNNFV